MIVKECELPPYSGGELQPVTLSKGVATATRRSDGWTSNPGRVVQAADTPRSYAVETSTGQVRRNCSYLRNCTDINIPLRNLRENHVLFIIVIVCIYNFVCIVRILWCVK